MNSTVANLYLRRDLLHELVVSELRSSASETRLGWVWWLIDPLFTMLIYWAVVVGIFGRGGQYHPYPIFILCALLPFKHFGKLDQLLLQAAAQPRGPDQVGSVPDHGAAAFGGPVGLRLLSLRPGRRC